MNHQATQTALAVSSEWRKSSFSQGSDDCVEVAWADVAGIPTVGAFRDSKNPSGPVLVCGAAAFATLIAHTKAALVTG